MVFNTHKKIFEYSYLVTLGHFARLLKVERQNRKKSQTYQNFKKRFFSGNGCSILPNDAYFFKIVG